MRVVAGSAGGLRLEAPAGTDVRPTADRVREAVFNALASLGVVEDARVLDLFAGSGALGIEALSRGARAAVFVDRDPRALDAVRRNSTSTGLASRTEIVHSDAFAYLRGSASAFDLVLLDPPYRFAEWDTLVEALASAVTADTVAVIESDRDVEVPVEWRVERRKRYGSTFVAIVRPPEVRRPSPPEPR
jgi:16S rRNA (guanine966-N2)-methyltransferase